MDILLGNIQSQIQTDNPDLLNALYKKYAFNVPGARYVPAYNRRRGSGARCWDGKEHFISKEGVFLSGLLSRILTDLAKIECTPTITPFEAVVEDWNNKLEPVDEYEFRDYQETLITLGLTNKRGILKSPTGSGKTLILAGLVKNYFLQFPNDYILCVFPSKQLVKQTYEFLTKCDKLFKTKDMLGYCTGEGVKNGLIMLTTVQSIEKAQAYWNTDYIGMIVFDEAHEFSQSKARRLVLQGFPEAHYRLGLTATPPSDDISRHFLEGGLGPVIEVATSEDLIEEGHLAKPRIQIIRTPLLTSATVEENKDKTYPEIYQEYIVHNDYRNNRIKDIIKIIQKKDTSKAVILVKNLEHLHILADLIPGSIILQGSQDLTVRYELIRKFLRKKHGVIIATKILQTGINIPEISHFIDARAMEKDIPTLQAIGRAMRVKKDNVAWIYDFKDEAKYIAKHSRKRFRHYREVG